MADLTGKEASQSIKITGADSSGTESNYVNSHSDGSLKTYSPGFSTGVNSIVAVSNSSTQLLPANTNRKFVRISNTSGTAIWIKFGDPAVLNQGDRLNSGGVMYINADNLWLGAINAIKAGGGTVNIDVFEGTP